MNIIKSVVWFMGLLVLFNVQAQTSTSAFNYQGELLDNGSPANGLYDINFTAFDTNNLTVEVGFYAASNVMVNNGLFVIPELDFGENTLLDNDELWLSIEIKKSSEPVSAFEVLLEAQKVTNVPYATKAYMADGAAFATQSFWANEALALNINGSTADDILVYDGNSWLPQNNPWQQQGNILSTTANDSGQQVTVGTTAATSTARLTVASMGNGITTQFKGVGGMFNEYIEDGIPRGYIGSVQDGSLSGTGSDDFEVGTAVANDGKLHLTIKAVPKLTIAANGSVGIGNTEPTGRLQVGSNALFVANSDKVGIGTPIPTAKLQVNASASQGAALDVKIENQSRLKVHSNEGTSIGKDVTPPVEGLYVEGDIKQSSASNGMLKYMVRVNCLTSGSTITRFHNGVNTANITVSDLGSTGACAVNFPSNINERYWQVSAISSSGNHYANCHNVFANNQLICQRTLSGAFNNGEMMILVY